MSIWHLLILAVVVLLVFGTGKLSSIGPDLGAAIRGFKKNLNGEDEPGFRPQEKLQAEVSPSGSSVRQDPSEHIGKP